MKSITGGRSSSLEWLRRDSLGISCAREVGQRGLNVRRRRQRQMCIRDSLPGLQVGTLLAGAILTETIFSWPGLGRWLIDALDKAQPTSVIKRNTLSGFCGRSS
ncbi:hypothetical protein GEO96_23070 [Salmonella enterica subsp. enterica serovar Anatum]|nr:hypothetical protein [Salmonella enterica subsp. enterica serovar Anatum]